MAIQDTQSEAWCHGFNWAGLSHNKGIDERTEELGYDFDGPEWHEFMRGAEFRQREQLLDLDPGALDD